MDILISTNFLNYKGVPTYTLTLYNQLVVRGHNVTVYCPNYGVLASRINTISSLEFAGWPDVILAQHNILAREMKVKWPKIPMIFTSHDAKYDLEQPPVDIEIDQYIAISEEVRLNLVSCGITDAKIIFNFIDIDRFCCKEPVRKKLERLLFISNYRRGREFRTIREACKIMGIKFRQVGYTSHPKYEVEEYINQSDMVITISRGAFESMSCERPTIIYECRGGGDGYVDEKMYPKSMVNNLTGRTFCIDYTPETLVKEIEKYNPDDGIINRNIILEHHNHIKGVDSIMEIINGIR